MDAQIKYVVDDTLTSKKLSTYVQATYIRYIQFAKRCIKESALFPLLERLRSGDRMGRNQSILYHDCLVRQSPEHDELELSEEFFI